MSRRHDTPALVPILREVIRSARRSMVSSLLVAAIVGTAVASGVVVAGRSLQAERDALARVDAAATRTIVVAVTAGPGVTAEEVDVLRAVSSVEWVVGLGPIEDVVNERAGGAGPAPSRAWVGDLPTDLVTVTGREPTAGEALVGVEAATTLALGPGSGSVMSTTGRDTPVVGLIDARSPVDELRGILLVRAPHGIEPEARRLLVHPASMRGLATVAAIVARQLEDGGRRQVAIETDEDLAALGQALSGDLARTSRQVLAGITLGGAVIVATVVLGMVMLRRRDIGRRRALGATRGVVVAVLAGQTAVAALLGAALGAAVSIAARPVAGVEPPVVLAVAILTFVAAVLGAVPPTVVAAFRDPVAVLRTP